VVKFKKDTGVSTIAAIMMIIILGILGASFVSLLDTEQYGYLNYYESAQSFYNANAGIEWGLRQQASTTSPIPFAGGGISVDVTGGTITATGTMNAGKRVIQIQNPFITEEERSEGCESFTVSDSASYSPYVTSYSNPSGGVGDTVYIKIRSTTVTSCSAGTPTLSRAVVTLKDLKCPNDEFILSAVSNWSCSGPLTDADCTDYYEYTTSFELPGGWANTSASLEVKLKKGGDDFKTYDVITIGQADCSSVSFYSDPGYSIKVTPKEFEKGSTYYARVITNNLNDAPPKNNKGRFKISDFHNNSIFEDNNFFSLNGTNSIICNGGTYSYGSYEGSFTVPDMPPLSGSGWNGEPTAGWYYNFEIYLEAVLGNCIYDYKNAMKIIANIGGGGGPAEPLDEAASQASATQSTPGTPDWHGAKGGSDKFIVKLINETGIDIIITGFDLSSNAAQPNLKKVWTRTAANGWNKRAVWDGDQPLPTGLLNVNQGGIDDWTIQANSYIVIDGFRFKNNINPGMFTLTVYFQGGVSSTLTFTLP
jgi:hypothetical protein